MGRSTKKREMGESWAVPKVMHACMTFAAGFGRLMACCVIVVLWYRGHVLLQGGNLPSPTALRRFVDAAKPDHATCLQATSRRWFDQTAL